MKMKLQKRIACILFMLIGSVNCTYGQSNEIIEVPCGEHIFIPQKSRHRVENRGEEMLRIVEIQTGDYLGEDDIVRYDDDYGREGTN